LVKIVLAFCAFTLLACSKKTENAENALASTAAPIAVTAGTAAVVVAPGAVTASQGGSVPNAAPKAAAVGGHAGGVQVQVGGKKIEVATGPNGQVNISGLDGIAKAAAPAPAAKAPAPASGPCALLAAKCPKCTLPLLKQTCNVAVASGDPSSCQNGLNDHDVQANCK
jgi:hypothetical protein